MRITTVHDIQRLIDSKIPEGPSLEYKEALPLSGREARKELLKDLTGMANGGGGSLLFGVREESNDNPIPIEITPLADLALISTMEDIVRAGVHPPIRLEYEVIDADGGYVLSVDVDRSPLGPYMVEAYGEHRYYERIGRSTAPMSEHRVRDAYTLASRMMEYRDVAWGDHRLPMAPLTSAPWLSVAGLPDRPRVTKVDLGTLEPEAIRPPDPIRRLLEMLGVQLAIGRFGRWADGYFGMDGPSVESAWTQIRVHRDGAAVVAHQLRESMSATYIARMLNAQLLYLSWLWTTAVEVAGAIEIRARIDNLRGCTLGRESDQFFLNEWPIIEPPGVLVDVVEETEFVSARQLERASERHRFVKRFADRIYQAFGRARMIVPFECGQLYNNHGYLANFGVDLRASGIWNPAGTRQAGIRDDRAVVNAHGELIAFWHDGAVIDPNGDTLAVVELSVSSACPDQFVPAQLANEPRAVVERGALDDPESTDNPIAGPSPTARWAAKTLTEVLTA